MATESEEGECSEQKRHICCHDTILVSSKGDLKTFEKFMSSLGTSCKLCCWHDPVGPILESKLPMRLADLGQQILCSLMK